MTTTTTTPITTATTTPATTRTSRSRTAVIAAVGVLAGAGIAAGLVLGLGGGSTQQPATPAPVPAVTHVAPVAQAPAIPSNRETPAPKPAPAATPSPAIETLQRELGQLNYYEGPITGTMNSQTVDAVKYLQRDAHLPQTGTMDAATQQALVTMLAHGNNQMGS